MKRFVALALAVSTPSSVLAEIVPQTASNGVVVDLGTDSFADLRAVSSPIIEFAAGPDGSGKFQVEERISKGERQGLTIQGYVIYKENDWRFYQAAIYRGGDAARFKRTGGDVIACGRTYFSDQKGCSFSEDFVIETSHDEVAAHSAADSLDIRVTDKGGQSFTLSIPVKYFAAVEEISAREAAK